MENTWNNAEEFLCELLFSILVACIRLHIWVLSSLHIYVGTNIILVVSQLLFMYMVIYMAYCGLCTYPGSLDRLYGLLCGCIHLPNCAIYVLSYVGTIPSACLYDSLYIQTMINTLPKPFLSVKMRFIIINQPNNPILSCKTT